jgi:hypothetical protein
MSDSTMPSSRWATLNKQLEQPVQIQAVPLELAPQVLAPQVLAPAASARSELERAVSASEQVASAAPDPTVVAADARFLRPDRWAGLAGESDGLAARRAATDVVAWVSRWRRCSTMTTAPNKKAPPVVAGQSHWD